MKLNQKAVDRAKELIKQHQYVLDSGWSKAQPSAEEENHYLEKHDWQAYGQWHLGIDTTGEEAKKEYYHFPYGDFRRVHRSGLIAAKQRAAQNHYQDIVAAADALLHMIDQEKSN